MASVQYRFSMEEFPYDKVDSARLSQEITTSTITHVLDYINVNSGCDVWFKAEIDEAEETTLSGIVATHNGEPLTPEAEPVDLPDELRDRSGKLRVHQTSRKMGTRIVWTGAGDNSSNISNVFGGEPLTFEFNTTSGTDTLSKYIDFNIIENETWLHEGYVTWKNCHFEKLTLQMVPRVTGITVSSGTNYDLYGGYLVVPTYPGTGTIEITSDITDPKGGLIYMPDDDLGNAPTNTFWNADWNSTTKKFENITAALAGDGRYNMFSMEIVFAEFVSQMPLLANGFIALNSSDTDQMGQGMRLKMLLEKGHHNGVEEIVGIACLLCLHRTKST